MDEDELSTLSECEAAFRRLFRETSAPFDLTFHSVDGCHHQIRWSKDDIEVKWIHGRKPFRIEERRVIGRLAIPRRPGESDSSITSGSSLVTVPRSDDRTLEKRFVNLARAAGSLLPHDLFCNWSNVVGEMNSNPESLWFAMLFSEYADPLVYFMNGEMRFHNEVTVYKPIDASIRMAAGIAQWDGVLITNCEPTQPDESAIEQPQTLDSLERPPEFEATSDWVFSADLARQIDIKRICEIRKKAEVEGVDEQGKWGIDSVGTFRRNAHGRLAAYYIPRLKPLYKTRYANYLKTLQTDGGSIGNLQNPE